MVVVTTGPAKPVSNPARNAGRGPRGRRTPAFWTFGLHTVRHLASHHE